MEDQDADAGFESTLLVGWGDVDALGHMANTAYLNKAADVRLRFLAGHGFTKPELMRIGIVPIARRDAIDYVREFHFHDDLRVNFLLGGLSPDGSHAIWANEFYRGADLAAKLTTRIGFMDLRARRLTTPPEELVTALLTLRRTDDFEGLASAVRTD